MNLLLARVMMMVFIQAGKLSVSSSALLGAKMDVFGDGCRSPPACRRCVLKVKPNVAGITVWFHV